MSEIEKLPRGWEMYSLGDVVDIHDYERKPINNSERNARVENKEHSSLYPYYGATGQVGWIDDYLSEGESVLVGEDAAPFLDPIKDKAYLVNGKFWVNNHAHILRGLQSMVFNKFILHQMNYVDYQGHVSGSTRLKLTKSALTKMPFLLCSYNEQMRIIDKLEELFSELDSGVKELKLAQIKLTQYRQSLLKSSVEGSLTQQWREANSRSIQETGAQLLERILIERRKHWEQQKLAEFAEKGNPPPKNWQDKYLEPVQPDTSDLPVLPEGWVWASLDMLGDIVSGVTKGTKRKVEAEKREVPYLRVANVQRGFLNLDEIKTILATKSDIEKYTLQPGDILFNEGGDRDKLGRGWVWHGEVENCIHQNHVFRMRAFVPELVPKFISHHGNTFGKLWFQNAGKQTTNLASINKGVLKSFPVPLAPVIEQNKIIEVLEEELTLLTKQEEYTLAALAASEAQRKNILKSAFSGQLVPQDPKDEPASVLLEKIKAEREALVKIVKPRTPRQPRKKVNVMDTLLEVLIAEDSWIDAQEAFKKCGVVDGTSTDRIEKIYTELRQLEKAGRIEIERNGDYDQLKLIKQDVKENECV